MSGGYRKHKPSEALEPFVDCFWTRVGREGAETRILPDGAIDIIFDLAAPSPTTAGLVVGTMTTPLVFKSMRTSDYVAVRFRPGGAQPLFGNSMRELSDRRVELGLIWSLQVASEWSERLRETSSTADRVRLLERLLVGRIPWVPRPEPRVREAIRRVCLSGGSLSVDQLSRGIGLTRQHLTRLFERHVGVGVKFYSRVIRLRRVLSALERVSSERYPVDWARLALDSGYFDQAHFVRDFRTLTGLTPEPFYRQTYRQT